MTRYKGLGTILSFSFVFVVGRAGLFPRAFYEGTLLLPPCLEPFLRECFPTSIKLSAFSSSCGLFFCLFVFLNLLSALSCCLFSAIPPPNTIIFRCDLPTPVSPALSSGWHFPRFRNNLPLIYSSWLRCSFFVSLPLFVDSPPAHCKRRFYRLHASWKRTKASFYLGNLTMLEECQTCLGFESFM